MTTPTGSSQILPTPKETQSLPPPTQPNETDVEAPTKKLVLFQLQKEILEVQLLSASQMTHSDAILSDPKLTIVINEGFIIVEKKRPRTAKPIDKPIPLKQHDLRSRPFTDK